MLPYLRQSETVKLQQSEMRRCSNERSLEAIKTGKNVYIQNNDYEPDVGDYKPDHDVALKA